MIGLISGKYFLKNSMLEKKSKKIPEKKIIFRKLHGKWKLPCLSGNFLKNGNFHDFLQIIICPWKMPCLLDFFFSFSASPFEVFQSF